MNMTKIFTNEFVEQIKAILDEKCQPGGPIVTRKDICEAMGLDTDHANLISLVLNNGYLEGYGLTKGRYGGAYRDADRAAKKALGNQVNLSDEFKTQLRTALQQHCTPEAKLSRKEVAELMGSPDSATETKISAALKLDEFSDYRIARGAGIRLATVNEEDNTSDEGSEGLPELKPTSKQPLAWEAAAAKLREETRTANETQSE